MMKKLLLLNLLLGLCIGSFAQSNRVKLDPNTAPLKKSIYSVDQSLNLSKEVNSYAMSKQALTEKIIGVTKYDLQSNGSCQNRVYRFSDGTIGAAWTMGSINPGFSDRGTGYNYFDGTNWGTEPTARIEKERCGWPSIASLGANGEIVVTHNGDDGLVVNTRATKGTGAWASSKIIGPLNSINTTALLWPRMVTEGDTIHIISTTDQSTTTTPALYEGLNRAIVYQRSKDGGATWDKQNVILPGMDSSLYVGFVGDGYDWAEPKGNTIAFVIGDNWHDLFLMKSIDGGDNWTKTMIYQHPFPKFKEETTMVLDTIWVCDGSVNCVLDNNGDAHVFFGVMRVNNDDLTDEQTSFWPVTDGIGYWNESMGQFTSLDVDSLDASGNLVGWMPDVDDDGTYTWIGTYETPLYYLSLSSMPTSHIDANGDIYLIFSSIHELLSNGSQMYKHLWARKSSDGGQTWGEFSDLNGGILHDFDECVFASVAPNSDDGSLHIIYQSDSEPGLAVRGDEDAYASNSICYIKVDTADIGTGIGVREDINPIANVKMFPNPASDYINISLVLDKKSDVNIYVNNILGQRVMEIPQGDLMTGQNNITIETNKLKKGIYFFSVNAGSYQTTKKIVVR